MNILFLIGNGFDLNLEMPTKYSDFYKYYTSVKSSSSLIEKLKKEIDGNIKNWSDLELAFGKFTSKLKTTDEFNEVFEDIEDNLANYLESVESNFDYAQFEGKNLYKYLAYPENSLPPADRNKLKAFKQRWNPVQWNIHLISFNYTKSLEKLIDYNNKPIQINDFIRRPTPVTLHKIEHIHGYLNERMVLGVNDVSQVSNSSFHTNQEVIESLIKSECNQAQKHDIDIWCKSQISSANLICIFGSSIGDTDNLWWELIGKQLKKDCNLIIFERGEKIPPRRPQKGKIAERNKKNYFLRKTKLNKKEKDEIDNKVFIGINTEMFRLKAKK